MINPKLVFRPLRDVAVVVIFRFYPFVGFVHKERNTFSFTRWRQLRYLVRNIFAGCTRLVAHPGELNVWLCPASHPVCVGFRIWGV